MYEQLKLENQVCFLFYSNSRLITKLYQPYLKELNLTYPKYLILLVLWEKDKQLITQISDKLLLGTNTITPLINSMIKNKLITKKQSKNDKRSFIVNLTKKGKDLEEKAKIIPGCLVQDFDMDMNKLIKLKSELEEFMGKLVEKN